MANARPEGETNIRVISSTTFVTPQLDEVESGNGGEEDGEDGEEIDGDVDDEEGERDGDADDGEGEEGGEEEERRRSSQERHASLTQAEKGEM